MEAKTSPLYISALERGLRVLEAFGSGAEALSLPDVTAAAGLTKSAAQRALYTLNELGYVSKDPKTKQYRLTLKCLETGYNYLSKDQLVRRANPHLHALNALCGETCSLSEPSGNTMVFVARYPSHKSLYVYFPIGLRIPMYCAASGRAFLSRLPTDEAKTIIESTDLIQYTENTISDAQTLLELVDEARRRGFAWANGEFFQGDINVGAAVVDKSGRPIGAVNISVPSSRWTLERACTELGPKVLETCRAV